MMDQPPKKKRKLLIVDIGEDGLPIATSSLPPQRLPGIEDTHQKLQQYVKDLMTHFQFQGEVDPNIWKRVDQILTAQTQEEANALISAASQHALAFFQGAAGGSPGR